MPTPSFKLRRRSTRRASAVRPLPARRLRSEVAAAGSALSTLAGVSASGLGGDGAWSDDGIRALLAAAEATGASLLLAAAATAASDSAAGGERPGGGRPRKKNQRGKRKRTGFQGRKGKMQGTVGNKRALVALAAARRPPPAACHLLPPLNLQPRCPP